MQKYYYLQTLISVKICHMTVQAFNAHSC